MLKIVPVLSEKIIGPISVMDGLSPTCKILTIVSNQSYPENSIIDFQTYNASINSPEKELELNKLSRLLELKFAQYQHIITTLDNLNIQKSYYNNPIIIIDPPILILNK